MNDLLTPQLRPSQKPLLLQELTDREWAALDPNNAIPPLGEEHQIKALATKGDQNPMIGLSKGHLVPVSDQQGVGPFEMKTDLSHSPAFMPKIVLHHHLSRSFNGHKAPEKLRASVKIAPSALPLVSL